MLPQGFTPLRSAAAVVFSLAFGSEMKRVSTEIIDSIPWSQLAHAYGSAEDLPPYLYDLFNSEDEDALDEAVYHCLHSCACHQYTTYSCTADVVRCVLFLISEKVVGYGLMPEVLSFIAACQYGAKSDDRLNQAIRDGRLVYERYSLHQDKKVAERAHALLRVVEKHK